MRTYIPAQNRIALLFTLLAPLALLSACDTLVGGTLSGGDPPIDRPVFPTGLALHPDGDTLAVVSSNFDSRYATGALFFADLEPVDTALATNDDNPALITAPYSTPVFLPSFGFRPVFAQDGQRLVISTRADNLLAEVLVNTQGGVKVPNCGGAVPAAGSQAAVCGDTPFGARLPGNDPYEIVVYEEDASRMNGVVTFLRHSEIAFFVLRNTVTTDARIRITTKEIGDDVLGVRGATLLPRPGRSPLVVATADVIRTDSTRQGADLIWFDPAQGESTNIRRLDLQAATGAEAARSMAMTPDGEALIVVTRAPDGIVRLDVTQSGSQVAFDVGGVATICADPSGLTAVELPNGTRRMLAACLNDDAVVAFDPVTLDITDMVHDFGRGPFDIAVDTASVPARAYVSHYYDDSVGVYALTDDDGAFRLTPRVRLGTQSPPPEDGR